MKRGPLLIHVILPEVQKSWNIIHWIWKERSWFPFAIRSPDYSLYNVDSMYIRVPKRREYRPHVHEALLEWRLILPTMDIDDCQISDDHGIRLDCKTWTMNDDTSECCSRTYWVNIHCSHWGRRNVQVSFYSYGKSVHYVSTEVHVNAPQKNPKNNDRFPLSLCRGGILHEAQHQNYHARRWKLKRLCQY